MQPSSRRDFFRHSLAGSVVCALAAPFRTSLRTQQPVEPRYDLLIQGGRVVDPSQRLSAVRDLAITGDKVVRVAENIPAAEARRVIDARNRIVTPGLIDCHVHVYDGVTSFGIPPDPSCIAKGVTTALDAGSAGAHTFPAFRRHVINVADTRIFALLNLAVVGLSTYSRDNPHGELLELRYVNPRLAIRTIEQNRDVILGLKVRLSEDITGERDLRVLALAREAADAVKLPLMVHIGNSHSPLREIVAHLARGDVITHCFTGRGNGVLDSAGRVIPEIRAAVNRGVHLDVGHGGGSFSWDVAERALKQDLIPGTISSDVHQFNVHGPVFDLATTLSKFLHLGLSLEQVIERATTNPGNLFGFPRGLGTLREGSIADVAIFTLAEGDFTLVDAMGQKRVAQRKLVPVATIKAGRIYGSATIPIPGSRE